MGNGSELLSGSEQPYRHVHEKAYRISADDPSVQAKKIDLILTKSIQRFARNTLDCINYTRILRQLGIGVLFEKENINSLPPDSEFMITMYGAMAQSESESISGNIRRGRQMHAKVGTLKVPCYRLYGYEKDTEGKFRVIPEQAEIVRELYKRYESGASLRNLQECRSDGAILYARPSRGHR